ncbi:MAG: hypothetical protein ACFFD2_06885 [Promethearchaeota archaeon]
MGKNSDKVLEMDVKNGEKITIKRIELDFWRTDLHGKEIGIHQKAQQRAKSRQFSKDMDLYGAVKIGKEDAGNIGFRTTEWEKDAVANGQLKRLIIRYFSVSENWVASLEEDTINGLMRSVAHKEELPVFNLFHRGNPNIFTLERVEREFGQMARAVVSLILEKNGKTVEFFMFDEKRATLGSDWKVYRPNKKKPLLAELDSKKFNIGGKLIITVYDPVLAENKIFIHTLILFGALLKFWNEVNHDLKEAFKKFNKEGFIFQPNRAELDLLKNPRRYTR